MIKQTKIAMSMCSHLYKQKNKLVKNNLKFFLSKLSLNYKNILIKIRMHFSSILTFYSMPFETLNEGGMLGNRLLGNQKT